MEIVQSCGSDLSSLITGNTLIVQAGDLAG